MTSLESTEAERLGIEAVHRRLREAILEGEIAPGATMSQVALACEFGISRTPLREALRMLQTEGLVDAEHNRRVRVASISAVDLEELYVTRITLETEAIRLAIPRMTADDFDRLDTMLAEMSHDAGGLNYRRWSIQHRAFHHALIARAGARFDALVMQLHDHAERYRRLYIGLGPSDWATTDHGDILAACRARDGERAGRLLADHLVRTAFTLIGRLDPAHDPALLREALADVSG